MSAEIAPAWIPADLHELQKQTAAIGFFANRFHLDVNDGVFVPAISWPCGEGQWEELERMAETRALPHLDTIRYDVHLMAADPGRMGSLFARAGASCIIGHIEAFADEEEVRATLAEWRASGAVEVGLTLLLDTPLSKLDAVADAIDVVQVMSIAKVGFQKQAFQERAIERVREIHARWPSVAIVVDGGVSNANVQALVNAGATRLVMGSAIMTASSPSDAYHAASNIVSQG
jgi:ribulose-phosphate 3-epimerase